MKNAQKTLEIDIGFVKTINFSIIEEHLLYLWKTKEDPSVVLERLSTSVKFLKSLLKVMTPDPEPLPVDTLDDVRLLATYLCTSLTDTSYKDVRRIRSTPRFSFRVTKACC